MSNLEDFARVVALLGKYAKPDHTTALIARDAEVLRKTSARLAKHAENECNRPVTEAEEKRAERHEQALRDMLAAGYDGVKLRVTGDPRGYIVRLVCRDGEYNTWGGVEEGWGVA